MRARPQQRRFRARVISRAAPRPSSREKDEDQPISKSQTPLPLSINPQANIMASPSALRLAALALLLILALSLLASTASAARVGAAFAPLDGGGAHGRALRTWFWRPYYRPWVVEERPRFVWWG